MEFKYAEFDLLKTDWLPHDWEEQVFSVSDEYSKLIYLDGKSSTSREPEDTEGVNYKIVLGGIIRQEIKWLYDLYSLHFLELASGVNQGQTLASSDIDSSININIISGIGARYEWHVDTNPLTGLFFVTTHSHEDGGQLLFRGVSGDKVVLPKAGTLLLFDARKIPHTVLPLKKDINRLSIPMNYYTPEWTIEKVRPADLDLYIGVA